jgi:hypothetical protein
MSMMSLGIDMSIARMTGGTGRGSSQDWTIDWTHSAIDGLQEDPSDGRFTAVLTLSGNSKLQRAGPYYEICRTIKKSFLKGRTPHDD